MGFRIKAVLGTGNVSISGAGYAVGTSAQGSTSIHLGLSLISKAWSSSELVSPSAVSVPVLGRFYLLNTMQILPGFGTSNVSDY